MAAAAGSSNTAGTGSTATTATPEVAGTDETAGTAALVRTVGAALLAAAAVLSAVLFLANRPDWWRGFAAASVVSVLASAASVPVVAWGMRQGRSRPELSASAFLVGAAVRAGVSLGGAAVAFKLGGYPKEATLLLVVPFYFALLAAETYVMARSLWKAGGAATAKASPPTIQVSGQAEHATEHATEQTHA